MYIKIYIKTVTQSCLVGLDNFQIRTETCRSCFNVNFNIVFFFKTTH